MRVRAKFAVTKVAELGDMNGKRCEITVVKKHVPANVADPDDGSVTLYDRTVHESSGVPAREITLSAVCDNGDVENRSFAQATPSGNITFYLNNAACADEFKPGDTYYVEFERVELTAKS